MISEEVIRGIVAAAVHAPSGDNAQPWSFSLVEGDLLVSNLEERDPTLYNFRQRGSYLAHGALAENIAIAAARAGYDAAIRPFPGARGCTMRVSFKSAAPCESPLCDAIEKRATNRKRYQLRDLEPAHRDKLIAAAAGTPGITFKLVEGNEYVRALAETVSVNERLLFEHRSLHTFLFGIIRWTEAQERAKPGLYIKTMEFPPPLQFIIKYVLCHWPIVSVLNKMGLSKQIARDSAKNHAASSAIGAIIASDLTNASFFNAGYVFQRVWLTTTSLGLSLQPITAIPYLMQRVEAGEIDSFSREHVSLIREAASSIAKQFAVRGTEHVAMLFRIGYDGEPTARSMKLPPSFANA